MKRIIFSTILILALVFSLCSCSIGNKDEYKLGLAYKLKLGEEAEEENVFYADLLAAGVLVKSGSGEPVKAVFEVIPACIGFGEDGKIKFCDAYSSAGHGGIGKEYIPELEDLQKKAVENASFYGYWSESELELKVLSCFDACRDAEADKPGRAETDFTICLKAFSDNKIDALVLKQLCVFSLYENGQLSEASCEERNASELEYLRAYCTGKGLEDIKSIPFDAKTGLPAESVFARNCNINHFSEILELIY